METLRFVAVPRMAGETTLAPELFPAAWEECIELHLTDKQTWVTKTIATICRYDRYEVGMYSGDEVVGGLTLVVDDDPHVGQCLLVMSQYVLPEFRNQGVSLRSMRCAVQIARRLGHTVLAYTHRVGDWKYLTQYRRIHGNTR